MAKFMQMTQTNLEEMKASQEAERKNNEAARKMFETQLGQMVKQMAELKTIRKIMRVARL